MKLVVGLGNPGKKYTGNRHNIGFMAVDALAASHGLSVFKNKFHGDIGELVAGGEKCLLLKPLTYMNRSGLSVGELMAFYKLSPADCLVVHDEIDLPFGEIREKVGGGHAGHNGLRDIDRVIGKEYARVRLGVGHPGDKDRVADYVLSDFSMAEKRQLPALLDEAVRRMEAFIEASSP
jgi:PTH1 family peptidyl-tRNA hydrolase